MNGCDLRIVTELLPSAEVDVVRGKVGGTWVPAGQTIRVQPQLRVLSEIRQLQGSAAGGEEVQHDAVAE
jgi:hypothetical protein